MKPDIKEAEVIPKFLQDSFIDWEMQVRLSGTYNIRELPKKIGKVIKRIFYYLHIQPKNQRHDYVSRKV